MRHFQKYQQDLETMLDVLGPLRAGAINWTKGAQADSDSVICGDNS